MKKIEGQTREKILLSALTLFSERGISRTSVNEIAYRAGVTRVTTWLQLSARENPFDWRMSWDALVDRAPYWDSKDVFLPPPPEAEVARIREHDIPAYHQFVRDVIDAGFQPTA